MIFAGRNKVTQPYGAKHGGIDIVGVDHTTVHCVAAGTVELIQKWDGKTKTGSQSYGNLVIVNDGSKRYYYAHLKSFACTKGQSLTVGDAVGIFGSTGNSTGPHCHFEVRTGKTTKTRINPAPFAGVDNVKGIYDEQQLRVHIVKKGDCLFKIAKRYLGKGSRYPEIKELNNMTSDIIHIGQKLKIPNT